MTATKQELRTLWLQNRCNLSETEKNNLSFEISDRLTDHISIQSADCINIFLPVYEKCEVRTWSIIQYFQEKYSHIQLSAPRIKDFKKKEMESVGLEKHTIYIKNKWGIEEPEFGPVIDPGKIDLIFLPLISFDKHGHRLGYGGGFYDRYLKDCPHATKVGLSYFEPIEEIPEISEYDVPMNICITPHSVYHFSYAEKFTAP